MTALSLAQLIDEVRPLIASAAVVFTEEMA